MADESTYLAPTTELMAVNQMLRSIGETPVDTLSDSIPEDAGAALDFLRSVSRGTQLEGWDFNTDTEFPIDPDVDGYVPLPVNTLKVKSAASRPDIKVVQRGQRLYDRINQTLKFTEAVLVDIVIMLPFEELPEAARQYIFLRAGQMFQQGQVGSVTLDRFAQANVLLARQTLESAEADTGNYNFLTDNWSVFKIVQRTAPP